MNQYIKENNVSMWGLMSRQTSIWNKTFLQWIVSIRISTAKEIGAKTMWYEKRNKMILVSVWQLTNRISANRKTDVELPELFLFLIFNNDENQAIDSPENSIDITVWDSHCLLRKQLAFVSFVIHTLLSVSFSNDTFDDCVADNYNKKRNISRRYDGYHLR